MDMMKRFLLLILLTFIAVIAWRIGERMSSDAISMGLGVLLGVLAGVPTALLLLVSTRGRRGDEEMGARGQGQYGHYPQMAAQPPVIVITGPASAPQALPSSRATPAPRARPRQGGINRAPSGSSKWWASGKNGWRSGSLFVDLFVVCALAQFFGHALKRTLRRGEVIQPERFGRRHLRPNR